MNKPNSDALKETLLESKQVFKGKFLDVRYDTVRLPDGGSATREYLLHPGACVVIPLLDNGDVVLEKQYRYPIGQTLIEFPAGKLDAGEDTLLCAARELHEETGYTATEWASAGGMHLAIAYSSEIIHIYFARGLKLGQRKLDEGEFLDVFTAPAEQLIAWCLDGTVTDAKTQTCALHLQQLLLGKKTLIWQPAPSLLR